jgi:predicted DsbA family dithiol-disulfide isomerase
MLRRKDLLHEVAQDVREAEKQGVEVRPTLIFTNAQGDRVTTAGLRSFSLFEQAIEALDAE